jgi:hypothetical protein
MRKGMRLGLVEKLIPNFSPAYVQQTAFLTIPNTQSK